LYRIRTYPDAAEQIEALSYDALTLYTQVRAVLELVPWNGSPYAEDKPDGNMRQFFFGPSGQGFVIYLILEDQQLVDVLRVVWLDWP